MRNPNDKPKPDDADPGDTAALSLSINVPIGTFETWVKAERQVTARPGETADDLTDRVNRLTLDHLAKAHDAMKKMLGGH